MARVFVDANVLLSAAYRPESRLGELWSLPGTELVTSELGLEETRRNARLHCPEGMARLGKLARRMRVVSSAPEAVLPARLALVAEDRPILAAAVAARRTHLLTGDKRHFGRLYGRKVAGVLILTPGQYLRRRRGCRQQQARRRRDRR